MIQDEKLKKLVEQNGTEDWKVIANFLPVGGYWFLFPVLVTTLLSEVSKYGKGEWLLYSYIFAGDIKPPQMEISEI